ncbi:TrkA family potassium uptake protein [Candidatus Cyanaurora vandensis]|uniref:potassium channel family protein n=1 Tax=Candidatus Cyanaurora vandensis TaxID=2714958 RepID=UPI00257E6BF3|nr:TrkA C-terminal domain-containing protein [Candidatus Cyanaurora vandensis]
MLQTRVQRLQVIRRQLQLSILAIFGVVLSAKLLNPKILTIARAGSEEGVKKLTRVGADRVVSPYLTGAKRMAALALRPQVVDFMEAAFVGKNSTFYIEELLLNGDSGCPVFQKTLKEVDLRTQSGALVLAIRRSAGDLIGGPTGDTLLEEGDLLICMGTSEQLQVLANILIPNQRVRG